MLTFLCVLNTKNIFTTSKKIYSKKDVYELKNYIEKYYTKKHNFICLSDINLDFCEYKLLTENHLAYWAKLELFKYDFGKSIYFDLDIIIKNNINWLDDLDINSKNFWALPSPLYSKDFNSSFMAWEGKIEEIYKDFNINLFKNNEYGPLNYKKFRYKYGDQSWIKDQLTNTDINCKYLDNDKIINYSLTSDKDIEKADIVFLSGETNRKSNVIFNNNKLYKNNITTKDAYKFFENEKLLKKLFFKNILNEKYFLEFIIKYIKLYLNNESDRSRNKFIFNYVTSHNIPEFNQNNLFNKMFDSSSSISKISENLKETIKNSLYKYEKRLEEINK